MKPFRTILVVVAVALTIVLSGALQIGAPMSNHPRVSAQVSSSNCPSRNVFRMTLVIPPTSLNSLTFVTGSSSSYLIGMEYYSAYPIPKQDGTPFWDTAVTNSITHNSNYTVWTLNVKPGFKWSNGQNVTGQDIVDTFSNKFALNATYDFPGLASELTRGYAPNSSAAVFVLNQSDAHWAEKISWMYFSSVYPSSIINSQGPATPNLGTVVADGPFYTSNYSAGSFQMKLLRNPYYSPQPQICEMDVNFVDSLSATSTYLQSGTTDLAPVELSNALSVIKNPNIHLSFTNASGVQSLEYNVTVYPYNMTAFRQALAYGIDQSQIVANALNGLGQAGYTAEGAVSPVAAAWYNPNTVKYSFNQTMSTSLLNSIGITKGSDGVLRYPNGTAVSLTLYADTDNPSDVIAAQLVQKNLQSLGMMINTVTTSEANIIGQYSTNVNNIARTGMLLYSPGVPIFGNAWLSSQPGWDTYFAPTVPNINWEYPPNIDAQYHDNLTAIDGTDNPAQLKGYLANIQALNAQYLPTLILAYPDAILAYNTQHWTNWPSGPNSAIQFEPQFPNMTALATLQPVGASTTSSSAVLSSSSSSSLSSTGLANSTSSSSSTSQATTSVVTSSTGTSSTSTGGGGIGTGTLAAIAVVVVIIVIAGVVLAARRGRRPAP